MIRRLGFAAALLLVAAGCDSGSDAIGLTGRWEGTLTDASATYPVQLRLADTGQSITGSGQVSLPNTPVAFSVPSGSFVGTTVDLQLMFNETPFRGSLSGQLVQTDPGRIDGSFSGPRMANGTVRIELVAR